MRLSSRAVRSEHAFFSGPQQAPVLRLLGRSVRRGPEGSAPLHSGYEKRSPGIANQRDSINSIPCVILSAARARRERKSKPGSPEIPVLDFWGGKTPSIVESENSVSGFLTKRICHKPSSKSTVVSALRASPGKGRKMLAQGEALGSRIKQSESTPPKASAQSGAPTSADVAVVGVKQLLRLERSA